MKVQKLTFPDRITVELTNQCNVSCTFCPRQCMQMEIGFMEMDLYKKIIDEASSHLPVKLVIFFRGESLLHPQFMECVRYAKEKKIGPIQFATNALGLTSELAEQIADAGVDFISFSLDTIDPEVYKQSRLTGDLSVSMENVKQMSEICADRKRRGLFSPTLQVSTIEIPVYMERQEEFIQFWKKYADIVRVYYEHDDQGRFRNKAIQKQLEREVPERLPCRKVFTDMLIYWDGRLALCNYDWRGELKGINVNHMSLQEAWDSEYYEEIRNMHMEKCISDDIMCRDCDHWRIDYMADGFLGKVYKRGDTI